MPLIPMNQKITIVRAGEEDEWGDPITPSQRIALKCRVVEESKIVQNSIGEEAVAGMKVSLDKLVDVRYSDKIEYTNELSQTVTKSPIRIAVVRMPSGKPIMTKVYV